MKKDKNGKQAGAELCQAQVKMGLAKLAKLALTRKKLRATYSKFEVIKKLMWSFVA